MKSLQFQKVNIQEEDVLTRIQMKQVVGGHDGNTCKVTNTQGDGSGTIWTITFPAGYSCSEQSQWTGNFADNAQVENGGSTHYDCGCDGWGS